MDSVRDSINATLNKAKALSDDDANLLVHQLNGWTFVPLHTDGSRDVWVDKRGNRLGKHEVPDYVHDLNAMHKAEQTLKRGPIGAHSQMSSYRIILYRLLELDGEEPVEWGHAIARQRAEAFIICLGGVS